MTTLATFVLVLPLFITSAFANLPVASSPICTRLLAGHGELVEALAHAARVSGRSVNDLEAALFHELKIEGVRLEDTTRIAFAVVEHDTFRFAVDLPDRPALALEFGRIHDGFVKFRTAEVRDLDPMIAALVPNDEDLASRIALGVRELLADPAAASRQVGDIVLQSVALLESLDYVYVNPKHSLSFPGFDKGWVPRAQYDRTWAEQGYSGWQSTKPLIQCWWQGVHLGLPLATGLRTIEKLGYRWNDARRRFEKNAALPHLDLLFYP